MEIFKLTKDLEIGGTLTSAEREMIGNITDIKVVDLPEGSLWVGNTLWDVTVTPYMGPPRTYRLIPDTELNRSRVFD